MGCFLYPDKCVVLCNAEIIATPEKLVLREQHITVQSRVAQQAHNQGALPTEPTKRGHSKIEK